MDYMNFSSYRSMGSILSLCRVTRAEQEQGAEYSQFISVGESEPAGFLKLALLDNARTQLSPKP